MTWSYIGPASGDKDIVRFLISDTNQGNPLLSDEEIAYALTLYPTSTNLAAAYVLRSLCVRYAMRGYTKSGNEVADFRGLADALQAQIAYLDPTGVTSGGTSVRPSFGGRSHTEKDILYSDDDFVQARFNRGDVDDDE